MPLDPCRIREDFPVLKRRIDGHSLIYLDNAASSQKPKQVIEAMKDFYENHYANVHRGVHTLSQEASEAYEEAHSKVADFISAEGPEEVIFVGGTTEAINLVAYSWGLNNLHEGDEVLTTLMEHHSNIVPWNLLMRLRGISVKYVGVTENGALDYDEFEEKVTERTRLVCAVHASNVLGTINDVRRISKLAHEFDALCLVDGAQSAPHMPVSVKEIGCDFFAFSGHKMLGPTGIGVLFGKKEILDAMSPFLGGGGMISEVHFNPVGASCSISWNELPWKFEAGTPNIAGGIGLAASVDYLKEVGMREVRRHEKELTAYAMEGMDGLGKIRIYGPRDPEMRGGVISFNVDGMSPHDVGMLLDQHGIAVRSGHHCAEPLHEALGAKDGSVRASFYIYNTREEVEELIGELEVIEKIPEGSG